MTRNSPMKSLLTEAIRAIAPERRVMTAGDRKWLRSLLAIGYLPHQLKPELEKGGWNVTEEEIAALAPRPRKPKRRADDVQTPSATSTTNTAAAVSTKGDRTPGKGSPSKSKSPTLPTPGGFPVRPDSDDL